MFQKKYTISSLAALISYNKSFLYAAVGSTHNERILKESSFFEEVLNDREIPDGKISLSGFSDILLVTIGDTFLISHGWLSNTMNIRGICSDGYFNKMVCCVRVVLEC